MQRAREVAEHEVTLAVGMWSSGTGPSASTNVTPIAEWSSCSIAAVDDAHVAGPELPRLVPDRHRHRALEDQHHLLRVLVAVSRHRRPGGVRDPAEEDLVAGDRLESHPLEDA